MPTLADLRARLPELDGLDDESAVLAIQQAYYPSVPVEAVAQRLGYTPPKPKAEEPSFARSAADSGIALGQGIVTGVKGLTDLAGADNPVSQALGSANETMSGMLSAFRQNELQQRAQKIKEAEESGSTLNEVGAYLGGFAEAPLDTTLQAVGTMVPNIAAMMIPGVRESRIAALAARGAVGAAQGTGFVKGGIYESVKQRAIEEGRSPEEAEALAVEAQRYGGKNSGQIALGTVLGAGAALGPVERIASGMARRTATQGMLKAPEKWLPRVALGAGAEAFPEGLQGGQQKLAENLAQDRAGFETDPMRGVLGSAALEAAAAAGPGGAVSLPKPAAEAPKPRKPRKPSLAEGLTKIAEAPTVDDAIKAMGDALDPAAKPEPEAAGGGLDRLRTVLPDEQRREVIGLMATAGNPNAAPHVRRYAENRIDAIIREYTDIPVADVIEEADMLPTGEARELTDAERADFASARRFSDERRIARGIPTGEATEVGFAELNAATQTGDVTEEPARKIPVGKATEIEPEVIDGDLLTGDGMPYGSKAGALVRAKREGLTPGNVVEIPGAGWVVRPVIEARPAGTRGTTAADVLPKETPREPVGNMAGTAGQPADGGAGRAPDAGGSSVAVGGMATDPGRGDADTAGTPVAGGAEAAPAGDGGGADQALKAVGGEYTLSDAISADGPTEETVKLIVRPDGTAAIQRDDGDVIDVTNMARAGYTAERIIAQSLGDDTSGSNVKRSGAKNGGGADAALMQQADADPIQRPQRLTSGYLRYRFTTAEDMDGQVGIAPPGWRNKDQKSYEVTLDRVGGPKDEQGKTKFYPTVTLGKYRSAETARKAAEGFVRQYRKSNAPTPPQPTQAPGTQALAQAAEALDSAPNVSNPAPAIDTPSERVDQAPAGGGVGAATERTNDTAAKLQARQDRKAKAEREDAAKAADAAEVEAGGVAQQPVTEQRTPKQYHDDKLRRMAAENGVPLAEVREMYDDEAGRAASEQEWVAEVVKAAESGQQLSRPTLDKLLEVRPNTRLPETAVPPGYQRPQARKAEADEKQARIDQRKAIKAERAPDTATKLQARQDRQARAERDEPTIELRKRLSVLKALKECIG